MPKRPHGQIVIHWEEDSSEEWGQGHWGVSLPADISGLRHLLDLRGANDLDVVIGRVITWLADHTTWTLDEPFSTGSPTHPGAIASVGLRDEPGRRFGTLGALRAELGRLSHLPDDLVVVVARPRRGEKQARFSIYSWLAPEEHCPEGPDDEGGQPVIPCLVIYPAN